MVRCSEAMTFAIISTLLVLSLPGCGPESMAITDEPPPPAEPRAIHAWLVEGRYTDWNAESRVHPGLNGTGRRVFLHESVVPEHSPVGAAAVRELYDSAEPGREQLGWSFLLKLDDTGDPDEDWFFYETFDIDSADRFAVARRGAPGCTFCHGAADDVIQSTVPLP